MLDCRDLHTHAEMLKDDIESTRSNLDHAVGIVVNVNATSDPIDYAEVVQAYSTVAELAQQLLRLTDELDMVEIAAVEQDLGASLQRMVKNGVCSRGSYTCCELHHLNHSVAAGP